jgi:acyl-CoA reductase-like NAD-dependent aldehyde dehydrogenase
MNYTGGEKMQTCKTWINGKWVNAKSGKIFTTNNPATGEAIAEIPLCEKEDVDMAVEAAGKALPTWSRKSQAERSDTLLRISDTIATHIDELAHADALTRGAPFKTAPIDSRVMAQTFKYAAEVSRAFMGQTIPASTDKVAFLQREPYGVCALYVSWNGSLISTAKKLSAALATGNTCIIKAPSVTSLTVLKFAEVLEKVGLPEGTVNVITGPGGLTGEYLAAHPGIDMISLTGGTETGKRVMSLASATLKHIGLELGGKNPCIVLEDADVDAAIANSLFLSFGNSGMTCTSIGRYYIHESLYSEFVDKFVDGAKKIVVGDPADEKTTMGPMISAEHRDKVEFYIKSGIQEGAKLVLGGQRPVNPPLDRGYYVMPTVFTEVTQSMKIAREEIFGPVACFLKYSSDDAVVDLANDTSYGLAAYIWTKNVPHGIKMAKQIKAGSVGINGATIGAEYPWGGYKESGLGKECSIMGMEEYVQYKLISFDLSR